jgi:hypothetical protein
LKLLILGSSSISYSGDGQSQAAHIQDALAELDPSREWVCLPRHLFLSPSMTQRALALVDDEKPDAVFLHMDGAQIMTDAVVFSLRRRWPSLFPLAMTIAQRMKRAAGGDEGASPRRWLFRWPRRLAVLILGTAPDVTVEDGIRLTSETIGELVRREGPDLLCGLPVSWESTYDASIATYRSSLISICRQHRIPTYETNAGFVWDPGIAAPDGTHGSDPVRRARAKVHASVILDAIGQSSGSSRRLG